MAYQAACGCNLRHPAKAVLKEMAWFADDAGQNIWPSVTTLSHRTGMSRRGVQKQLRALEQVGAIRTLGSRLGGRRKTTRYSIDLGWMEANAERANKLRPSSYDKSLRKQNGERQHSERANNQSENSESRSPEQKEQENEKNEVLHLLKTEKRQASSYEYQRLRQRIRKDSRELAMPSPMSKEELEARRLLLKNQAEALRRARLM
jgi:hypothetical protein